MIFPKTIAFRIKTWMVLFAMVETAFLKPEAQGKDLPVRLALVVDAPSASTAADVLTAELSKRGGLQLLERAEMARVSREQGLSVSNQDYLKLGQILGADGLLLLAYPLHPDGQPTKLRDVHLAGITMPVLCFNGTRDGLCTPEIMERVLTTVTAPWTMHWIEGADHSFRVLKSTGRDDAAVLAEVGDAAAEWVTHLSVR